MKDFIISLLRYFWMLMPAVGVYALCMRLFHFQALALILAAVSAVVGIVAEDHASRDRKELARLREEKAKAE